jgi:ubiquinone/menaquinone biosynthesis C-methylase UbiE
MQKNNESADFLSEFLYPEQSSPVTERRVKFLISHLKGLTILDAGCGTGFISRIARKKGFNAISIDVDYTSITLSKLASNMTENKGPLVWASITSLPFRDGIFDAVICSEVLEHIPHIRQAISELSRVSKESARLCISIPGLTYLFADIWVKLFRSKHSEWFDKNKFQLISRSVPRNEGGPFVYHVNKFTPRSILNILASCGFRKIAFKNGYFISHLFSAFLLGIFGKKRKDIKLLEIIDLKFASYLPLVLGGNWLIICEKSVNNA